MSVPKTPDMPFNGKDAYGDEAFMRLSLAEQALFWFLAWWQWQEGSIPSDIEDVIERLPRRQEADARMAWPAMARFFPSSGSLSDGRLANATLERKRLKATGKRALQQLGASLTNQKRWGAGQNGGRTETALESTNGHEEVSTHVPDPDFAAASKIHAQTEASGLRVPPPLQLVIAWIGKFGAELVSETIEDCNGQLSGKHFRYLAEILTTRLDDPSQRPGRRAKVRQMTGNNGDTPQRGPDGLLIPVREGDYWGGS